MKNFLLSEYVAVQFQRLEFNKGKTWQILDEKPIEIRDASFRAECG